MHAVECLMSATFPQIGIFNACQRYSAVVSGDHEMHLFVGGVEEAGTVQLHLLVARFVLLVLLESHPARRRLSLLYASVSIVLVLVITYDEDECQNRLDFQVKHQPRLLKLSGKGGRGFRRILQTTTIIRPSG